MVEKDIAKYITINAVGQLTAIQNIYVGLISKYDEDSKEKTMLENELKHIDDIVTTIVRLYNEKYNKF